MEVDNEEQGMVSQGQHNYPEFLMRMVSGHLADVDLIVGPDGRHKIFKAHKLVLASCSDVFHAMFYGPLKETGDAVRIPDCDPEAFKHVIEFMYMDKESSIPAEHVLKVLYIGRKYMLPRLKEPLYLLSMILTEKNVCQMLDNAIYAEEAEMVDYCLSYICMHAKHILSQKLVINNCSRTAIWLISVQNDLHLSGELQLFNCLHEWGKNQCKMAGEQETPENIRNHLGDCLHNVRYSVMKKEELDMIRPTRLIPMESRTTLKSSTQVFNYPVNGKKNLVSFHLRIIVTSFIRITKIVSIKIPKGTLFLMEEGGSHVWELEVIPTPLSNVENSFDIVNCPMLRPNVTYYLSVTRTNIHRDSSNHMVHWDLQTLRFSPLQVIIPKRASLIGYKPYSGSFVYSYASPNPY